MNVLTARAGSLRAAVGQAAAWPAEVTLRQKAIWALTLTVTIAVTIAAVRAPVDYRALGNYGYLGVFLITLIGTGAIVVPMPYIGAILIAGTFLDPRLVALVAGSAAAIGEMTGYLVGYSGRSLLPTGRWYTQVESAMRRFGPAMIFGASVIPNPFFDALGVIAGATRLPVAWFMIACFLGKTMRFWLLAAVGGRLLGLYGL
jgi:membrane protein YqaA with SNARE-associated domain